jgi:hypothetical protein
MKVENDYLRLEGCGGCGGKRVVGYNQCMLYACMEIQKFQKIKNCVEWKVTGF